ncbi:MAG TPA: phosphate ABC transporter permease PstA [Gammaproteobacteria bacterium]
MTHNLKGWFRGGTPWVWLNAAAVSASIVIVAGLLLLIAVRGMGHFWPKSIMQAQYKSEEGQFEQLIGERVDYEVVPAERLRGAGVEVPEGVTEMGRVLLKVGNRDVSGVDFRWVLEPRLEQVGFPDNLMTLERREWGNFYGRLKAVKEHGTTVAEGEAAWEDLQKRLERAHDLDGKIRAIEKGEIGSINYQLEQLRLKERRMELDNDINPVKQAAIEAERRQLQARYDSLQGELEALHEASGRDSLMAEVAGGQEVELPLAKVVRAYRPNAMSLPSKMGFYVMKLWEFLSDEPREANTEGGIFPAIFGTVLMVILMSIFVTPFGVVAAVYLREYAKQGPLTRIIRIAVNNLAGVPAIVYGVFGLGFFVYFLGGNIDRLFYPEALPSPTFGSGGILWASLTLAILTVPVVIVATEEGLSRIPKSIREGSLALGATKAETLWRTVLPMASPAMMTGLILAIARAAGEVAPLMLVGVVKLAPSLPLDLNAPFLHLERKFMHLGFHIHDVGFQSPNVEAARPLVYATALLLVGVIVLLNLSAIAIRNRLRERYRALEH